MPIDPPLERGFEDKEKLEDEMFRNIYVHVLLTIYSIQDRTANGLLRMKDNAFFDNWAPKTPIISRLRSGVADILLQDA